MKTFKLTCLAAVLTVAATTAHADVIAATQPGDAKLTCKQLVKQIDEMDALIGNAQASQAKSKVVSGGFGILQSVVPHFGGSMGGTIGAMQAAGTASSVANVGAQNAEQTIQQAQMRRVTLMGIHTGKGCDNAPGSSASAKADKVASAQPVKAETEPKKNSGSGNK